MYVKGDGVAQDHKAAIKWFSLAAKQGNAQAPSRLGAMLGNGIGVAKDEIKGLMWLNIAITNGLNGATKARDFIAQNLTPVETSKAQQMARECIEKNYKGC